MFTINWPTMLAILGSVHGLFFGLLLLLKPGKDTARKIFALLLLATSIRIAKNIVVHATLIDPDLRIPTTLWRGLVNFGLTHQFAIGPLFLFYFRSRLQHDFSISRRALLHFLPYLILLLATPWLTWSFWKYGGLWLSYISILLYYLLAFRAFHLDGKNQNSLDRGTSKWLNALLIIVGVLLLTYSPALFHYVGYIGGAVLYAIGIYVVSAVLFQGGRSSDLLRDKYRSSGLRQPQLAEIKLSLEDLMRDTAPFKDPDLNLAKLAERLEVAPHQLSQTINVSFRKSYSDYINHLRVEEVKRLLLSPESAGQKIATIAYESGFNSLSTFYSIFKKETGLSPKQFQQQHQVKN